MNIRVICCQCRSNSEDSCLMEIGMSQTEQPFQNLDGLSMLCQALKCLQLGDGSGHATSVFPNDQQVQYTGMQSIQMRLCMCTESCTSKDLLLGTLQKR